MKKGISFYFGYDIPPVERTEMIKSSGFDSVMTMADHNYDNQNGTIENQVELFKKNNLSLSSLHMHYKNYNIEDFWKDNELGDQLEANLIYDVETAAKFGFTCVVVHLFGEYNEIGVKRLERVLKVCEKSNIPLAIENIDDPETFKLTMEYFKNHPYVKMCYDCGHNHVIDPEFDYLSIYGDKVICLHLHDNMGNQGKKIEELTPDCDHHTLNKYGSINWDGLAKKLAKLPNELNLDYELLFYKKCPETAKEVLAETYKQACDLEEKILNYKNKIK